MRTPDTNMISGRKNTLMQRTIISVLLLLLLAVVGQAQEIDWKSFDPKKATPEEWEKVLDFMERNGQLLQKTTGDQREIKSLIMRGNKITTIVYNYGNITRPNTLGNVADLVWNRLGYGFEFTPLVAAEVVDANGDTVRILDDGMWLPSQGGYSPDGTQKWGWLPKPGYAASGQADIAAWSHRSDVGGDLTRRPRSWPESFYNNTLGRYVWPAFLGNDATTPDEEVFFVMDDYTNQKYQYYPFPNDSTKRGLGLDMEVRFFQFNNPLAEDIIFLVYRVTNRSPKTLSKVYFGMHGDPHVGGPTDFSDDRGYFIPPSGPLADPYPQRARSMVYAWDDDMKGAGGLPAGYFGFKFLESPSNSTDGIDNDDDGLTDESPFNEAGVYIDGVNIPLTFGVSDTAKFRAVYGDLLPRWSGDEDGDWDPTKDDVGIDGLPGTGDLGEGNGKPDIGINGDGNINSEPNFGIRDVSESDQIGLTAFWVLPYTNSLPNVPKNDLFYYDLLSSDSISIDQELLTTPSDNVFIYGSGPFTLEPGGTQRFSIALLMGNDLPDLLLNSETAQRVLEANYRFAQPPPKPNVVAVPGEGRVTLYWDTIAEEAVDPLTAQNDFEGYKIYRSEDPTFADIYTITDANGTPFLGRALLQNGTPAQFDLDNEWSGLHPIEYIGRGVKYDLGNNSGLVHSYVDSSVTNGKTYYYAVVSYDHGFDSLGVQLPPTESQAVIAQDPITGELSFDANTVAVVPGPTPTDLKPAGFSDANVERVAGVSTGEITVEILNPSLVDDGTTYDIRFDQSGTGVVYCVKPEKFITETFIGKDTLFANLSKQNLMSDSLEVRNATGGLVAPSSYSVDTAKGRIRGTAVGSLAIGEEFTIRYKYYSFVASPNLNKEDSNPVFDGLRVFVDDVVLGIDSANSGWANVNNTNLYVKLQRPQALGQPFTPQPFDIEIQWNSTDTTANGKWAFPGDTAITNNGQRIAVMPFRVVNVTNNQGFRLFVNSAATDSLWRPGRELILLTPAGTIQTYLSIMIARSDTNQIIYPTTGNVYVARMSKPFAAGDAYRFTVFAPAYSAEKARSELDNIYVVPNPYVVYSSLESPSTLPTRRGDSQLQFRNLPQRCTIRIYTILGELVDTIEKDDNRSFAPWALLSYEGHRLAYGVYIYHVEVPGVGEKIGRFALIK